MSKLPDYELSQDHVWTFTTNEDVYRCNVCSETRPLDDVLAYEACPGKRSWLERRAADR